MLIVAAFFLLPTIDRDAHCRSISPASNNRHDAHYRSIFSYNNRRDAHYRSDFCLQQSS